LRPRLVTLRGAQVSTLTVSNVDLRACRFFGAHGLESLTLEASCEWPRAPSERRYANRETIAEEHLWREWTNPYTQPAPWLDDGTDPLTATQLAGLYRALRKAREDDKDQAGAGDLYYGEMEMRRHAAAEPAPTRRGRAAGDRLILQLYWLLSGYGLKPGRALVAFTILLLIGAALLQYFGFHEPRSYGRSLLFSIESAISLLRPPDAKLSAGGETSRSRCACSARCCSASRSSQSGCESNARPHHPSSARARGACPASTDMEGVLSRGQREVRDGRAVVGARVGRRRARPRWSSV